MTHPNHQTNGASLEDCHTNFFALTDLCGIKWRKLLCTETSYSTDPLDDPVLASFSKCLAADILCVWRRVQAPRPPPASAPPTSANAFLSALDPMQAALGGGFHRQPPPQLMPPQPAPPPPDPTAALSLHSSKELWIFWYGEEPDLSGLVAPDLLGSDGEQGSWESGLSYECRSLLFKALHNLIERCLLSRDFVRLGKWFVQPYDGSEKIHGKSSHLSFSFAFFVHGESTVCASVDVRHHPPVRSLARHHLLTAQASSSGTHVILAPFGLSGILTGQTFKAMDSQTHRLLEEWRQFYPINNKYLGREANDGLPLPPAVEVIVGGAKMRYPSCYVLVTDMDDPTLLAAASAPGLQGVQLSPCGGAIIKGAAPDSLCCLAGTSAGGVPASPTPCSPPRETNSGRPSTVLGPRGSSPGPSLQLLADPALALADYTRETLDLSERVWHDCTLSNQQQASSTQMSQNSGDATLPPPQSNEQDNLGHWDFGDPTRKAVCICSKCKKSKHANLHKSGGLNSSNSSSLSSKVKGEKSEKSRWWRSGGTNTTPFHRRSPLSGDDWLAEPEAAPATRAACPGTPSGGPPSYRGNQALTPGPQQGGLNELLPVPSVGSPPSAAPSPLINPQSQPAANTPADPTMPTLSPHPPSSNQPGGGQPTTPLESQDKVTPAATPSDMNGPKSVSSVSNQVFSPYPAASSVEPSKAVDSQGPASASSATAQTPALPTPSVTNTSFLKRPVLASKDYETILMEEDQPSELLYDYSTLNAWLNHPVKRFKPSDPRPQDSTLRNQLPGPQDAGNGIPSATANGVGNNGFAQMEIKQEPGTAMEVDNMIPTKRSSSPSSADPYEFDDDVTGPAVSMEGFKRNNSIKDDEKKIGPNGVPYDAVAGNGPLNKNLAGDLFTSQGLQASYSDLDQIFDNSDDTSSDETMPALQPQVPTPPGSNKPASLPEDMGGTTLVKPPRGSGGSGVGGATGTMGCGTGILRPEELSKMFPTPPSLEHNPIASPCGQPEISMGDLSEAALAPRFKQEIYPNMGSPQEENIEDWTYVFKPPLISKMVGSSKYAPLTNLPSQTLPPVTLPTTCVYKPSWQYPIQMQEKSNTSQSHSASASVQGSSGPTPGPPAPHRPPSRPVSGLSPISPAAATMGHYPPNDMVSMSMQHHRGGIGPPLPPPYELPSPASNASSYLNKNVNSVEAGPISAAVAAARAPEASSLIVNILLADSSLHIFKDHNFDSCTMCVCNAGPRVVGNIRGADMYLPEAGGGFSTSSDDDPIRCSCGFSAIVNRRLSHRAGLFYEDEVEITGPSVIDDSFDRRKTSLLVVSASAGRRRGAELESADSANTKDSNNSNNNSSSPTSVDLVPLAVLELIREQCVFIRSSANALCRAANKAAASNESSLKWTLNILDYSDGNEVASVALEQGKQAATSDGLPACKLAGEEARRVSTAGLHRWQFVRAGGPHCNQDIVRVMRHLQPLLQDAVQKKCTTRLWEAPYTVSGPLTWRQFHRLAGRGTEDRCEPQPIPSLVVGHDKDWLSLSPYALQSWEKLLLEPYSYTRDVAYIVVAPDNDYILTRVRSFFKELSAIYEVCRLGRHCPITKVLRDGILRVGKTAAVKLAKEPVDEWFTMLSESPTTNMLKLYAQVCRHHLAPHLTQIPMDKTLLDSNDASQPRVNVERPAPSPMPPPSTPEGGSQSSVDRQPSTPKTEHDGDSSHSRDPGLCGPGGESHYEDEEREPPAVVVYLVEPFTLGSEMTDVQRLACLGLLRCFTAMLNAIPEHVRSNISVQIVSLETILELSKTRDRERHNDIVRSQALSVFSQCRRLLSHISNVKSLTGFGPAAMGDLFLKSKDDKNRAAYRQYTPPYVLAPTKDKTESSSEGQQERTSVLYCNYCLSEDQRFLLAACTDERGEIFETTCINIEIPNRTRRKKASARRVGLQKLMDFILGVMSRSVQPWRLVVGRIGRIGHGELKGWSWLLSRKSLLKASKHLKEICKQCSLLYPNDVPSILSACLVSLEPDSNLRLMPDQFTPDERFSATSVNCSLSTPHDVSCTHILVFPTSATTQSSQTAFQEQHINGPELGDDELLSALNDDMDGMDQDLNDLFSTWPETGPGAQSPTGSPRRDSVSQPGSPVGMGNSGQQSPFPCNANSMGSSGMGLEMQEEVGTLLQQPLALGYFVSTAATGRMPHWFWASCPHLEGVCPAFLKNALHLHSPSILQSSDDLLQQQSAVSVHPLDSQYTTDVLRYVLEGYNALSWLALDSNTRDRLSCLPVHVQALMQLYHTFSALV